MARKPGVRIFEYGVFHHWEKPHVAAQMEEAGIVQALYELRPHGQHFIGYQIKAVIASGSNRTACSLTRADSVINATAGRSLTKDLSDQRRHRIDQSRQERGLDPLPDADRIELVQDRVRYYPLEYDRKAPSIFNCKQRAGR